MATAPLPETAEKTKADRESYVPEGYESADEYLREMRDYYRADYAADRDNRTAAVDDKNFWAGDQWTKAALQYRKNLPTITINTLPQFTSQLTGDWRVNRPSIKVLPSEDGDVDTAEVRGDLIRAIETQSRADRAYDNAFESMVICGDGAFKVTVDYAREDVFDQDIVIAPIDDALSVLWDRMSIDPTGRDAKRCFVDDRMPREEFEERWPDQSPSDLGPRDASELSNEGWCDKDTVRVTEYWCMIERPRDLAMFADGKVIDVTDLPEEELAALGEPVRSRKAQVRYAQMHLVTGHAILEGPFEYRLTRLPIIRMTGRVINIAGDRQRFGMVRMMKEPSRLRNYWRSKSSEYLGYATKAKFKAAASAVEGREDQWRNSHLHDDTLLVYNDNAAGMPVEVNPPQLPTALVAAAAENAQDLKDVTGLHDASLGMRSNETSGVAINARQREGDVANVIFHDNGNAAVLEGGDVVNQLLGQVYDGARTVRTIGADESVKMVRANDPEFRPNEMVDKVVDLSSGRYDVTLSTGPSYTTRRVEAAAAMEQLIQSAPQLTNVIGDLYVKMLDVPNADKIAERIRRTMPPDLLEDDDKQGVPMQVKAQLEQLGQAFQALQAENASLQQDRSLEERKVEIQGYDAETKRIQAVTSKTFPLDEQGAAALQAIVMQAVRDTLASPDVLPPAQPPMADPSMMQPQMQMPDEGQRMEAPEQMPHPAMMPGPLPITDQPSPM